MEVRISYGEFMTVFSRTVAERSTSSPQIEYLIAPLANNTIRQLFVSTAPLRDDASVPERIITKQPIRKRANART